MSCTSPTSPTSPTNAVKLIFHEQTIEIVDEDVTSLDFTKKIISDYSFSDKEDPFFVMDVGQVLKQHFKWLKYLPRVKPFYAVKCNNNPVLLAILAHVGCSFDCASLQEMETILSMGVGPNRIIYANPCKTPSFIRQASLKGVKLMTFDHDMELVKIQKLYPNAEMVLRIAAPDPSAECQLSQKFGCDPETSAPALLKQAAEMNIKVVGISFHVGSSCHGPQAFADGIKYARRLFDIGSEYGHEMHILDVGGGYPGVDTEEISLEKIASIVNDALDEYFPLDYGARIIGEPGRYYAASAFTLCTNIIARNHVTADKITKNEAEKAAQGYMYYINDGVYGSFNNIVFDHAVPQPTTLKNHDMETFWSAIWGPTCDSMDMVIPKCKLPLLDEGEWLIFDKMGAYTLVASSEFNGFKRPNLFYIITKSDARLLAKTVHRSLSRDEPHATIPLPYVPKHALQDEGYSTDDFITELTNFDEDRGPDF